MGHYDVQDGDVVKQVIHCLRLVGVNSYTLISLWPTNPTDSGRNNSDCLHYVNNRSYIKTTVNLFKAVTGIHSNEHKGT